MLTPTILDDVVEWLDARTRPLPLETVDAREAAGRVAATTVAAPFDHPPSATSAEDGYALSARDTEGAGDYNPLSLRMVETGAEAGSGTARPVVSGEVLPDGTDAVLALPDADRRGGRLEIFNPIAAGDNVIPRGRETRRGETLLEPGRVLRPMDIALALELGIETLDVVRRPRVQLASWRRDTPDAGGAMIQSLVIRDGGTVQDARAVDDDIFEQADVDLWLLVGGTGIGPNDHAAEALESAGELAFRGVAINPGETTGIGRVAGAPVFLLPGMPLATWFAYELLAGRTLRRLAGRCVELPYPTRNVTLERKIASALGRVDCCRLRIQSDRAEPIAVADSYTLSSAVRADGFTLVPAQSEGFPAGAEVTACLFDPGDRDRGAPHG